MQPWLIDVVWLIDDTNFLYKIITFLEYSFGGGVGIFKSIKFCVEVGGPNQSFYNNKKIIFLLYLFKAEKKVKNIYNKSYSGKLFRCFVNWWSATDVIYRSWIWVLIFKN